MKPLTAAAETVVGRSPTGQQALALEHMLTGPPVLSGTHLQSLHRVAARLVM